MAKINFIVFYWKDREAESLPSHKNKLMVETITES